MLQTITKIAIYKAKKWILELMAIFFTTTIFDGLLIESSRYLAVAGSSENFLQLIGTTNWWPSTNDSWMNIESLADPESNNCNYSVNY